jgi:hypothetical protein
MRRKYEDWFQRKYATFLVLVIFCGVASLWASMKETKQTQKDRERWAYPLGVITVGGISSFKLVDNLTKDKTLEFKDSQESIENDQSLSEKIEEEQKSLKKTLFSAIDPMTRMLETCAARKRDNDEKLQSDVLYSFELSTEIDLNGKPLEIYFDELKGRGNLKDCIAPLIVEMQLLDFPARMIGISLQFTLRFEVRFLSDEEAMGRGFLYQIAEKNWQETLQARKRDWRKCEEDRDCTLVFYNCEIEAINTHSIGEYEEASKRRLKPKCDDRLSSKQMAQQDRRAVCQKKLCKVIRL